MEPGQKGRLRDIMDMSQYTGMIFGTVGEVGIGVCRTGPFFPSTYGTDINSVVTDLMAEPLHETNNADPTEQE
eukprot:jgi/Tetstr1/447103/TSEL_034541.t1